jgi:hypothetical protein
MCESIQERSRANAVSVVSHSIREYERALFVDEEIPSQLKHVRLEAQKPLSFSEKLEVPPVERRGQPRASQPRASHTPSGVSLPGSIE